MKEYDLIIVGAGISGMNAALKALESGIEKVLILEREENYGGILNQCIHCGFSLNGEMITGPEVVENIKEQLDKYNYEMKLKSTVLEVAKNKKVTYINEQDGISIVKTKALIIATGCRERYTGSVLIPTSKFTGVFTIGNAHRIITIDGILPGKNPVIIANSKWALILARRVELEGGNVKALIVNPDSGYKISDEDRQIIEGFDINLLENSKLIEVAGRKRVDSVKVIDLKTFEEKEFECDSLFLSVGYYPEIGMLEKLDIEMDKVNKSLKVNNYRTSIEWIFACGNVIYGTRCVEVKEIEGKLAGTEAHKYLESLKKA